MTKGTKLVNYRIGKIAQMINYYCSMNFFIQSHIYTHIHTPFVSSNQLALGEYLSCDLARALISPFNLTRFLSASPSPNFLSAQPSMIVIDLPPREYPKPST